MSSGSRPRSTQVNSACGSWVKRCRACSKAERDTKASLSNGFKLIRIRYRLGGGELPDLNPSELGKFLNFLLCTGKERTSVIFPRQQTKTKESDGLLGLKRLCRKDRWGLAHSVNSLRRNLPAGCPRCTPSRAAEFRTRQCSSSPPPSSPEYLAFCRREVRRIFPLGWDADYADFVDRFVPQASARLTKRSRGDLCWAGHLGKFRAGCLLGRCSTGPLLGRYKEVLSAGKVRPLSIFESRVDLLGPLHKAMYSRLAKTDWLLRGPPTPERITALGAKGTWFTSVDLVSATDNLRLDVAECILGAVLSRCTVVPGGIRLLAVNSLRPLLTGLDEPGWHEVTHGQMMGGYLSFPLLCLQSYLAARWATRGHEASFLVNGDDTIIATDHAVDASSYPPGMVLNSEKTIQAQTVMEINSTAFLQGRKGKWCEVHHLRRGSALTDWRGMLHLAAACRSRVEWTTAFVRSRIGRQWGFLPSQLGLHGASYPAFARQWGTRHVHTALPYQGKTVFDDDRLSLHRGLPEPDEVYALHQFQWEHGRPKEEKETKDPSPGEIRRTYLYRRGLRPRWRGSKLSYLTHLASLSVEVRRQEEKYVVPATYVSTKEMKAIRDLDLIQIASE
nr:RNA-dependent RNA polymerase [Ustilaginoidea virens botourmiavirus virus 8]